MKLDNSLYERDFYGWLRDQAEKLRARKLDDLDWENLAEEIGSLGRREKREIRSRLRKLLTYLLRWEIQPGLRSHSWLSAVTEERTWIAGILDDSPSPRGFPAEVLDQTYADARRRAADVTGLRMSALPEASPYTAEQALDDGF